MKHLITYNFLEDYLKFCSIKTESYIGLNKSINSFIEKLNNNIFDISTDKGKIYFLNSVLQSFITFMFNKNFIPPTEYRKKVQKYVNKVIYGKTS